MTEFMDRQIRLQQAGKKEYSEEEVRLIINGAIAEEREACAKTAEAVVPRHTECGNKIAGAIRARNNHD